MEEIENKKSLENEEHIKKVYKQKAAKYLKVSAIMAILMILIYVYGYILSINFDFGIILVVIDLALIGLAYDKVEQNKLELGKKLILVAYIPIVIELIYILIKILTDIEDVIYNLVRYISIIFGYHFYYIQILFFLIASIIIVTLLFKSYSSINKVQGNVAESYDITDDFYDSL